MNSYSGGGACRAKRPERDRRALLSLLLLLVMTSLPWRLRAQGHGVRVEGATPVVTTAVDEFKYKGADAVIVRRAHMLPHDVILVKREHVQARFLADAIHTLQVVRSAVGDVPTVDAVYRVRPRDRVGKRTAEAVGWVKSLSTTREMPLEGYGMRKQVILYVPNSVHRLP